RHERARLHREARGTTGRVVDLTLVRIGLDAALHHHRGDPGRHEEAVDRADLDLAADLDEVEDRVVRVASADGDVDATPAVGIVVVALGAAPRAAGGARRGAIHREVFVELFDGLFVDEALAARGGRRRRRGRLAAAAVADVAGVAVEGEAGGIELGLGF